jgi:hypothetical protein
MISETLFRQYQLARRLIGAGMRTKIVAAHTGLSDDRVRELWRKTHGRSPRSGPMPELHNMLRTRGRLVEGSLLLALYLHYHEAEEQAVDIRAILKAWEKWTALRDGYMDGYNCLTINELWLLARLYRQGELQRHRCGAYKCGFVHLEHPDINEPGCPVCNIARPRVEGPDVVVAQERHIPDHDACA